MQKKPTFSSRSPKKTKKVGRTSKPVDAEKKARLIELFNQILENDNIFGKIFQWLNLKNMWMLLQLNRQFKYEIV